MLVIGDGDAGKAAALAKALGLEILRWGPAGAMPRHYKPDEGIEAALSLAEEGRPVVLADRWDNPGGGVAGDSSVMVEALLRRPEIPAAIGAMWDPVAVSFCRAAGIGAEISLRFGGKAAPSSGRPIDATVRVLGTTENLLVPFEQSWVSLGAAAAISIGALDVVLASTRAQTFSPPVFTDLGVNLAAKTLVVVKSSNHFHAAFAPIAASILYLDSGGPYPPDARQIPYTKIRRPFSPLDPNPWL